jgi:hypothetical protein
LDSSATNTTGGGGGGGGGTSEYIKMLNKEQATRTQAVMASMPSAPIRPLYINTTPVTQTTTTTTTTTAAAAATTTSTGARTPQTPAMFQHLFNATPKSARTPGVKRIAIAVPSRAQG